VSADLQGKVALVTGASRGIGRAVALAFARQGADVALAARNPAPAEDVAAEIRGLGRKALALGLDVSDFAAVEEAAGRIEGDLGKVSILVNNAGITRDQLLLRMKPEDWSEVLRVNLDGTFHCTKVFCRDMMKARWGRIINVSSVVGVLGNAGQANYAASKAGILGFTRSVARELAGRGVTANAVAPGYIETAMTEALPENAKQALMGSIPLGRLGSPEDVAALVAFLAGDDAAYITGQVIHVDGGMVMA
jgi:3-oxoacyl-[acyl-carrier protein] reductase